MAAELIAIEGPLQGVILALDLGKEWLLGRDPQSCQLVVEDPKVERKACRIVLTEDGYSIQNLGDTPILINGRALNQAPINDGDVLKIGDSTFSFYTIEEFQEIVFGEAEESSPDEELIASEEGLTQHFQREGGGAEYSEENLPKEEPAEEFVGDKARKKSRAKEQEFKMEPAGRKQSESKGPKEEEFKKERTPKTGKRPKTPQEEEFARERGKDREPEGELGPEEEALAGEVEKGLSVARQTGPKEEAFSGGTEKAAKRKMPQGPSEEGFAGEAEREKAAAKERGPSEEAFSGEADREQKARGPFGPAEEGFAGEAEREKAAAKESGPSEEGFAGAGVDKEKKGEQSPKEEGFVREGKDQASADDWESEEGEASDFEKDELAEEAAVKKEEPSPGEELISEGSEKEHPLSKGKAGEELVSEGRDQKETFHEKPGEELKPEGVDHEQAFAQKPGEELVAEGADAEEFFAQKPGEELVSEGAESRPPNAPVEEMASEGAEREMAGEGEKASEELVYENIDFAEVPLEPEPPGEQLRGEGQESVVPPPPPPEEFEEEVFSEGDLEEEPLFDPEDETEGVIVDLTPSVRFLLKVIAGPNTGAEYVLDMGRNYLIGTEASNCDIVFHDLSVSREHARLYLSVKGELEIEDLGSRNGILIDQQQIRGRVPFNPNIVVSLGTTAFFIVDREAPQETLVAPAFEPPRRQPEEEKEEVPVEEAEEKPVEEPVVALKEETVETAKAKSGFSIYVSIVCGLAILLGISMVSLFHTKELKAPPKDFVAEIKHAVKDFPSVKYTYSPNSNRLFLVGHVATGIEKDELFYNLNALSFLKGIDDHVVNDEAIWQEMNILLSKQNDFKGVSMHSPRPAVFVLNGYLKTEKQASDLTDWVNTHFNYISLLENRVVVEEAVIEEVSSQLLHNGFGAVAVTFTNGELMLAGYVGSTQAYEFERLVHGFGQLPGIRNVQNFVVIVAPEQQVIDLNQRYPGRFKVTGYSKHGDVSINVVINGRILMRGDQLEGMTLTSIQPHAIFFEKDGLKYKLEYNK